MDVNIILKEPVIIDGKTVKPDGKPISVTEEVGFELIEAGAAVLDDGNAQVADEPSPETMMQEVIDAAVSAATTLLRSDKASLGTRLVEANEKADQLQAEMTTTKAYVRELELELLATKAFLAERDAEIASLKAQNTSAAKTTPKKGAAAETA